MKKEREKGITMRIAPISYFNVKSSSVEKKTVTFERRESTPKPTSFYTSSKRPTTLTPTLRYEEIEISNPSTADVVSALRDKDDKFAHNFLYGAVVAKHFPWGGEPVRKHVSYFCKGKIGTEFDSLLDRATNVGSAASNAYLMYWFEKCVSNDSKDKFADKKNSLIEQARKDLGKPNWSPSGIAYQSDVRYSGPQY